MKLLDKQGSEFMVQGETDLYLVILKPEISCTCRDFTHRRKPIMAFCKHIKFVLEGMKQ